MYLGTRLGKRTPASGIGRLADYDQPFRAETGRGRIRIPVASDPQPAVNHRLIGTTHLQ